MKKVFTVKDIDDIEANGGNYDSLPPKAILTPSAKDKMRDNMKKRGQGPKSAVVGATSIPAGKAPTFPIEEPTIPDLEYSWAPGGDPKTPAEIKRFFNSPEIMALKERMVSIGRRMWEREFVDGNGGNITVRVGDNLVLCTPTLNSKGLMAADMIALVDMDGNQIAGKRKRTSEVNTHIACMKATPKAKSVIHGHPAHSTAFAVASVRPPSCLCSEAEIFTGEIALVEYETPGSPENAVKVGEVAADHPAMLLENHGVMVWGKDLEDAYWKIENLETACKTIWIASQLGNGLHSIPKDKMQDIYAIRKQLGMADPREGMDDCETCDNSYFKGGNTSCALPQPDADSDCSCKVPTGNEGLNQDAEKLVAAIAEKILARVQSDDGLPL